VALANLAGDLLADEVLAVNVEAGPETIMEWALTNLERMLASVPKKHKKRLAIVVGLPGPVDFTTGAVVSPPIMGNWQDFDVRGFITARINAPVIIDNDVNLIALAEQRLAHPNSRVLMVIKLGTGVGGGLVIDGQVLRGARGAAGDIGHTQSTRAHGALCRCGHTGCVEAAAGGWALVQELSDRGLEVTNVSDVAQLVRDGDPIATSHVRAAAKAVALAAAQAVSLLNPDTLVIAGEMLGAGDAVLAQIREGVYQYSLPLATHDLTLVPSNLGSLVGLKGGAQLGIDYLLGTVTIPQLTKAAA
jgi:predicted NBD/HSP70 family sugar kinase